MGFGSFLKRATTIPSKGPLSGLRKVFGNSYADELGGAVGFAAGGPMGAGIGAGLGTAANTGSVGKGLGNAVKYGVAGAGAGALGVPGNAMGAPGFGAFLPRGVNLPRVSMGGGAPTFDPSSGEMLSGGSRGINLGGALAGFGRFLGGNDGANGLALAGMASGLYGAQQEGKAMDQDRALDRDQLAWNRARMEGFDAQRAKMMEQIMAQLAARRAS